MRCTERVSGNTLNRGRRKTGRGEQHFPGFCYVWGNRQASMEEDCIAARVVERGAGGTWQVDRAFGCCGCFFVGKRQELSAGMVSGGTNLRGIGRRGRTACLAARLRGGCPAGFRRLRRRNVRPRALDANLASNCRIPCLAAEDFFFALLLCCALRIPLYRGEKSAILSACKAARKGRPS